MKKSFKSSDLRYLAVIVIIAYHISEYGTIILKNSEF